jgi:hypothetical protein
MLLLFTAWLVGTCGMVLYLIRQQYRFHVAERAGASGPAVVGFFRPRIVLPTSFETQFSSDEQAAILAHERAHLARHDARINAIAALLRRLCWFNPLVHLASVWLRRDQELACDAAALRHVPALQYANTLLKAQIATLSLPLGSAWPGSEHPLTERVALLKRPPPEAARRRSGIFVIALVTLSGGVVAWAAQPETVRTTATQSIGAETRAIAEAVSAFKPKNQGVTSGAGGFAPMFKYLNEQARSHQLSGIFIIDGTGKMLGSTRKRDFNYESPSPDMMKGLSRQDKLLYQRTSVPRWFSA